MLPEETIDQLDNWFTTIINNLDAFGKEYKQKEKNVKILKALPVQWDAKTIVMRSVIKLDKLSTFELFSDLKVYENDVNRSVHLTESSNAQVTALVADSKM